MHDEREFNNLNLEAMEDESLRDALAVKTTAPLTSRHMSFTSALMHIAGSRTRSGRFWVAIAVTLTIVALLLMQVYFKHQVYNVGYSLSSAASEREALLEEQRKLRIELRILSSRERLEPIAYRNMGLSALRPEQIIYEKGDFKTPEGPRIGRVDGLDKLRKIIEDPQANPMPAVSHGDE